MTSYESPDPSTSPDTLFIPPSESVAQPTASFTPNGPVWSFRTLAAASVLSVALAAGGGVALAAASSSMDSQTGPGGNFNGFPGGAPGGGSTTTPGGSTLNGFPGGTAPGGSGGQQTPGLQTPGLLAPGATQQPLPSAPSPQPSTTPKLAEGLDT